MSPQVSQRTAVKMTRRIAVLAAAALGCCLIAAEAPEKKDAPLASSPAVTAVFKAAGKQSEDRLIPMVLRRPELSGDARTRLETELDLQVLVRWLSAIKPTSDDAAAISFIRLQQLQTALSLLQQQFAADPQAAFNNIQQNAAKQLHQLTFDLPAKPDLGRLDEICRNVGMYVLEISGGAAVNSSQIPPMRPGSLPPAAGEPSNGRANRASSAGRSEPSRLIPNLAVSQPLRQQLLSTLDMVEHPGQYDLNPEDAQQLRGMLREAIDISAGLSGNAGVTSDDRGQLERQLTESLALFSDRRLRDLGKERIGELGRYRQVLGSITKLNLSETNYKLLAPAFEYAQKNPNSSKQVLGAVEKFVGYNVIYDKTPTQLTYTANPALARTVQRPYDDSRRAFERARSEFLGAVEELGGGAIAGSDPKDLELRIEEMRISLEVIDALGAMPQALDTYALYRQKNATGLEKRIAKEASVAAAPGKGPLRQEAADALKTLVRVADSARELERMKIEGEDLRILNAYTRKGAEDFVAKWKSNVAEIVNQAAAGNPLDMARIDRNDRLLPLMQSLAGLRYIDAQFKQSEPLKRWADWGLDAPSLDQVVHSYRSAAAGAFLGFLSDDSNAMNAWPRAQREARPMISFLLRCIAGARNIPQPASPLQTECAKLMTPLVGQTFALQRYFSLAQVAIVSPGSDGEKAAELRDTLRQKLQQQ